MTLDAPSNPSGPFDVKVNIGSPPAYRAFNAQLTYDPTLLAVDSIDYGGVLGPKDAVFCLTPIKNDVGQALAACTLLGSTTVTSAGTAAVFHFRPLKAGTAKLHVTSFDEGGKATGAFVLSPSGTSMTPIAATAEDISVAVTP
jgi:hypothetical protein